ncbi:hypothetical protein PaeBR_20835 [Paenibacillus sp. BR2-3]|uniref:hypothetical protein n=1 Tax=Paenibacillus sp. BR2-3 TaxID=3048494 RepID=UPI003977BA50
MKKVLIMASLTLLLGAVVSGCQIRNKAADTASEQTNSSSVAVPWVGTKNTIRINTSDPVEAAVLVSRTLWTAVTENNRPASVVLTDVSNWQIGAVSTDLIHHPSNGPVLFVDKDGVPAATLEELKRLNPIGAEGNGGIQAVIVGPVASNVEKSDIRENLYNALNDAKEKEFNEQ